MREAMSEGNEVGGRRDDIADREADEVEGGLSEDYGKRLYIRICIHVHCVPTDTNTNMQFPFMQKWVLLQLAILWPLEAPPTFSQLSLVATPTPAYGL